MKKFALVVFALAAVLIGPALAFDPDRVAVLPGEEVPKDVHSGPGGNDTAAPSPGLLPGEEAPQEVFVAQQGKDTIDWGVARFDPMKLWEKTKGKGVKVAVLDTGCDLHHPDLESAIVGSKDYTGSKAGASDVNGHGTHVAGTIAARANGQGMVGVAPECSLLVVKVLGDAGAGSDAGIAAGIDQAVADGAHVVNLSLGAPTPSRRIHEAVQRAVAAGVIVVAAAGNSGPNEGTVGYPGGFPEAVCVGALDPADQVARFSSRGLPLWIAAPGTEIQSCYPGGRYAKMSGTSMATPHVAGAAALWVAAHPDTPPKDRQRDFRADLAKHAKDLGVPGRDSWHGHGLMQILPMLGGATPPPPPPGNGLVLTEQDLSPEAKARLEAAYPGGKFRLELPGLVPVLPREKKP